MEALAGYVLDWANLLVRWRHVTAAIAWIGTSFYYIALDYHLLPAKNTDELAGEVCGGVHSVRRSAPRPDHRDHRLLQQREIAAIKKRERRIDDLAQ